MAYEKITWYDSPDTSTPLNAENLNRLEDGVEAADNAASANADAIDELKGRMDTAESNISTAETNIATKEDVSNKWGFNYNMTSDAIRSSTTYYASNYYVEKCVTSKINEALASEDLKVDLSGYDSAISELSGSIETLSSEKEDVSNKVETELSNNIGTKLYPSTNAVYTFVNNKLKNAGYEETSNKLTAMPENNTTDENYSNTKYPSAKAVYDFVDSTVSDLGDLSSKEDVSNKRSSITAGTSTSTDYYPSNKAVVNYLKDNYCSKALYRLPVSVAFDENYMPLAITDSTVLGVNSLTIFDLTLHSAAGAKYIFISNKVTAVYDSTFPDTATDIYVDNSTTSQAYANATTYAPDGATVYDESGLLNADEFLLRAIYNLYNTLKVSEITSDNSASTDYYPSNKAVANYVDTAITNFENTWDFEALCNDVDNLSSNVDGLESNINTLTSKVTSTNMIYFKRGTSSWDEDIYIYFWNAAPSNFNNRYQANPSNSGANMGFKMTLIDEENGIYAYPRLNYTHMRFACTKVTDAEDLYYTTSDMLVPLQGQEKMPCYYQSSIGYDGVWGDLANDNVRIYLQSFISTIPTVTTDSGSLTVYPIGYAGNKVAFHPCYYYYVDVPADSEDVLTITIDGISTESSVFESCYNHTVFYCTSSEYIGYFNGDLDEFFRELIGYDNSKLS